MHLFYCDRNGDDQYEQGAGGTYEYDQTLANEAEVDDNLIVDDEENMADRDDGSEPDDAEDLDDRIDE